MCSISYAIVPQYVSCSRGSASASVSPSTYVAQQPGRDARLQLRRELRLHALGLERGIAGRLGAERVEPGREMAVRPVRLDERHRRGDAAEQLVVDLGGAAPAATPSSPARSRHRSCAARAAGRAGLQSEQLPSSAASKSERHSSGTDDGFSRYCSSS